MSNETKRVVKEFPVEMRPRERLKNDSPMALADHELLAILLGSGTRKTNVLELASNILFASGGLKGLPTMTLKSLSSIHGVGFSKACTILSLVELAKRIELTRDGALPEFIGSSDDAARRFFALLREATQEVFMVLFLDTKKHVIAVEQIFVGTLDCALVHPRDVFRQAVRHNAHAILCGHNHPSGDVQPSREDFSLTKRLSDAGNLLDIPLLDHLIIGKAATDYYSFRKEGKII